MRAEVLRAPVQLEAYPPTVCGDLVRWASEQPDAVFLAERDGPGWTTLSYGRALSRVKTLGAGLLRSSANAEAPLAIVALNGIEHALLALAAMYVGIPVAPLSVAYAVAGARAERLRDVLGALRPGLIYAGDEAIEARVRGDASGVPVFTDAAALDGDAAAADAAFVTVDPDTVAKIMFTSGSTGAPKGVITTNRMLSANQTQTAMAWPELADERPTIVDWLPWSHCMGGNHIFGIVLRHGGALYVDEGRPAPGAFAASVRNLRDVAPTLYFNVPRGFTLLLEALLRDEAFAERFFSRLRGLGNAAASLPNPVRAELARLARRHAPHDVRITSSWGMTESAPMATTSWGAAPPDDDTIGTPIPGVSLKLAPSDGRSEMRVKGPNVMPGYWRDPPATLAAFDEEGYYRTGDAGSLKNPADPARGIVFDGRLAENFKLATGAWVNVGALRLAVIERGAPLVEDVVFTGLDRDAIGALIFLRLDAAGDFAQRPGVDVATLARDSRVRAFAANLLAEHNAASPASSTRIERALLMKEPPNPSLGELTDKGSINQSRALLTRAADVARLYASPVDRDVITPQHSYGLV